MSDHYYLYVIGTESGFYKIGISNNPSTRLKDIKTGIPEAANLIFSILCKNKTAARRLEEHFHKELSEYHITGEWFKAPQSAIAELLFSLHKLTNVILDPHYEEPLEYKDTSRMVPPVTKEVFRARLLLDSLGIEGLLTTADCTKIIALKEGRTLHRNDVIRAMKKAAKLEPKDACYLGGSNSTPSILKLKSSTFTEQTKLTGSRLTGESWAA